MAMAAVSAPFLLLYFVLPESPRWLLSTGHIKGATAVVEKMFRGEYGIPYWATG